MMKIDKGATGGFICMFDDAIGKRAALVVTPSGGLLGFGRPSDPAYLSRSQVAELLPLLQHFVETGDLPYTESAHEPVSPTPEDYEAESAAMDIVTDDDDLDGTDADDYKQFAHVQHCTLDRMAATGRYDDPTGPVRQVSDDILPRYDVLHGTTKTGRTPRPSNYQELPRDDAPTPSPGERAFGAKVALIRRLNEMVYRFDETDLALFREMHTLLDKIDARRDDPPGTE